MTNCDNAQIGHPRMEICFSCRPIRGLTNAVLSMVGLRSSDAQTIAWMMTYWDENGSHYTLPKEDALRLAKACVHYDRNPKQRFVEMMASSTTYGFFLQQAFHSYDPDTQSFTDSPTTDTTAKGPVQLTHAERLLILMAQQQDDPNANFLERVMAASSKHSDNGAVPSPTSTPTPPLKAGDAITLLKPMTIQFHPYWGFPGVQSTIHLRAGSKVRFVSRNGDTVRFHAENVDYGLNGDFEVPADATDLK